MIKWEGLSTCPPKYTVVRVDLEDKTGSVLSLPPEQGEQVGLGRETVRRQLPRKYIKRFCIPLMASS